jgi:hypothetical protein
MSKINIFSLCFILCLVFSTSPTAAHAEDNVTPISAEPIQAKPDTSSLAYRINTTNKSLMHHIDQKIHSIDAALGGVDTLINRLTDIKNDFPLLIQHVYTMDQLFGKPLNMPMPSIKDDIQTFIIRIRNDIDYLDKQRLFLKSIKKHTRKRARSLQIALDLEAQGTDSKNTQNIIQDLTQDTQQIAALESTSQHIQSLKKNATEVEDSVGNRVLSIRTHLNKMEAVIKESGAGDDLSRFNAERKFIKKYIFQTEINIFDTAPDF